jgi:hypothetical protein
MAVAGGLPLADDLSFASCAFPFLTGAVVRQVELVPVMCCMRIAYSQMHCQLANKRAGLPLSAVVHPCTGSFYFCCFNTQRVGSVHRVQT